MSTPTVYLVTGANRGLGLSLVRLLLDRIDVVVFAGVRDATTAGGELASLKEKHPNALHVVQLASASVEDARAAASVVRQRTGRIDVIIANAGISRNYQRLEVVEISEARAHHEVNSLGPLVLFQAFYSLLNTPHPTLAKFVVVSSLVGSITIGASIPVPVGVYGASKASVNYITAKIAQENTGKLIAFVLSPGNVRTDMGDFGIQELSKLGFPIPPTLTPEESAEKQLAIIDGATTETSGKFVGVEGGTHPW